MHWNLAGLKSQWPTTANGDKLDRLLGKEKGSVRMRTTDKEAKVQSGPKPSQKTSIRAAGLALLGIC